VQVMGIGTMLFTLSVYMPCNDDDDVMLFQRWRSQSGGEKNVSFDTCTSINC